MAHSGNAEIIRARPDNAAALTEIAFASKRHWGYPERWINYWRESLTITEEFIRNNETFIADNKGMSVGFYALGGKATRMALLHLWVLPNAMGQGVGRRLFLHAVERAKALGVRQLEIESDPNAEGFYLHLGAVRVSSVLRELDQNTRELPVLIFEIR